MVVSSVYGEPYPLYEGVYMAGEHGEEVYYLTWVTA
jgi:hypothetical protein